MKIKCCFQKKEEEKGKCEHDHVCMCKCTEVYDCCVSMLFAKPQVYYKIPQCV